jgi:hypothetical protein
VVISCRYAIFKKIIRRTIGEDGSSQGCRVTITDFPGGQIKGRKMATEGHRRDGKKIHLQPRKTEVDKELDMIREWMEELALQMKQDARSHWVYE